MTEKQLTSLEAEIQKVDKGQERDAVRAWLKKNPGQLDEWAPLGDAKTE
jgi:glycine betaine/proline transport system substrate-binding protein